MCPLLHAYRWVMAKGDPRVADWPLMQSPLPIITVLAAYLYVVKVWGPRWMQSRPPFRIEGAMILYNVVMVLLSAWFFVEGGRLTYLPGGSYNLVCEPVDYSRRPAAMRILTVGWWFLLLKLVELLDTVFFVLRKKSSHVSVLHVTHHSLVAWGVWIGLKFGGGGHSSFFPLLNCAVHMLMYSYYCLAALGPRVRRFLWWKRYLTILQMVQFVVALVHACLPLFVDCGYQPFFAYTLIAHALLFWLMFLNFYTKRYTDDEKGSGAGSRSSRPPSSPSPVTQTADAVAASHDRHRQAICAHRRDGVRQLD